MSDYNNDSNDDLPYDGEDAEANVPTNDQFTGAQFPQAEYAKGEYAENGNSFYTNEYQPQDYYETPEDGQSNEQVEPVIFVNQSEENYAEDANIYSTELPNYQTNIAPQYAETTEYAETNEYVAAETYDDEGYVAADEYLEPNSHAESDYAPQTEPVLGEYAAETYSEQAYTDLAHAETGYAQPQYSESNFSAQEYAQSPYAEAGYASQPQAEPSYEEPQITSQGESGFEQGQYAADEYTADEYAPDQQNYDNIGYDEQGQLQAIGAASTIDSGPQDFGQEYIAETSNRRGFPMGWAVAGFALILLVGGGFYYLYANFVNPDATGDVPVVRADRSEIKTFPSTDSESQTSTNGSKNTDRIQNGAVDVGQSVGGTEPALLDSREDVVDDASKSEDRIEISDGVVADNDDKDIQNVLTLIKSSANNVEILLKPEDASQLDQNQISIDGLETILVDAKPVKLTDLIKQANQQPQSTLERIIPSNIDDLPVIGTGTDDPFKDIIDTNNAVATELPEEAAQPLPETDLSNAIAIVANQIASNQAVEPINVVTEAPKPVTRIVTKPIAPTSVPNALSRQVVVASGGAYGVQLASLPNEAAARRAYLQFSTKFPNILAGYTPIIREAIIPGKGTFYRVFAGPLISYSDANQLCANLRSAGISGCFARKM